MGQAFDREGNILGEAFGDTKLDVFKKLTNSFPEAHELRIKSLKDRLDQEEEALRSKGEQQ